MYATIGKRAVERVDYLNFDLRIQDGAGDQYRTSVLSSPTGEATANLASPELKPRGVETLHSRCQLLLGDWQASMSDMDSKNEAERVGELLFDALMSDDVRSCFDASLSIARYQGRGLRLRLRIEPPELVGLPWELMRDRRTGSYLALSMKTTIVRYPEVQLPASPVTTSYPLQVLVLLSSPRDKPPVDVEAEARQLSQTLGPLEEAGVVKLTVVREVNLLTIQRRLHDEQFHVLHYTGHGQFSAADGEGRLIFVDSEGESDPVSATKLGRLLCDEPSLRLVILNACATAAAAAADPFSGVATSLIRAGIPAVVAMQTSIGDLAARQFSQVFYQTLALGLPIDAAVSEGRKAIDFSARITTEWAIPQLFMRSPDGQLFHLESATPMTVAAIPTGESADLKHPVAVLPEASADAPSAYSEATSVDPTTAAPSAKSEVDGRPVSNAEYLRFVETRRTQPPAGWDPGRFPRHMAGEPVTGVSWQDAQAYAKWAGKRLPTTDEWAQASTSAGFTVSAGLWEWTAEEVKARGLGQQRTKRALVRLTRNSPPSFTARIERSSDWPEERQAQYSFRCAGQS